MELFNGKLWSTYQDSTKYPSLLSLSFHLEDIILKEKIVKFKNEKPELYSETRVSPCYTSNRNNPNTPKVNS